MKHYKITDSNTKFIRPESFKYKSFDVLTGNSIIHSIEKNLENTHSEGIPGWNSVVSMFGWPKHDVNQTLGVEMPVLSLIKPSIESTFYSNSQNPQEYSNVRRDENDTTRDVFQINCINEDNIRQFYGTDIFLYINFPVQFFREYLERIICNTQLRYFYDAIDKLEDFSIKGLIDFFNHYDKVHTDIAEYNGKSQSKPPFFYRWRRDLFLPMLYSIKELGYYNPVITKKLGSLFFDGSHRLGVGTALGYDYPLFVPLDSKLKVEDGVYVGSTPGMFLGESALLLEFDVNTKCIKGWWYDKEDIKENFSRFNYDPEEVLHVSHPIGIKEYYKKYKIKPADILFSV